MAQLTRGQFFTRHRSIPGRPGITPVITESYSASFTSDVILAEYSSAIVRPRGRFISRVKDLAGVCHDSEAEGNCVTVRWGGEQPEANWQSVG
uniref:Uncharacterized protein n=1 Tax=Candidatus Kentrum sp. FW TaxID=2126338 RepID=A0A450RT57_9GAMM|nr:MAG: hypothetical protein BECKFW1821A_GA0114235_100150 [Candidatus Kentron sp. FW]